MHTYLKLLLLLLISSSSALLARDDIDDYSVSEALASADAKSKLGDTVKFYFGETPYPTPKEKFGEFKTNKKTNAFNKSDKEACHWVFLSAMISLKERAVKEGGNAVVEIKSNYKGTLTSSDTTFKCGAGAIIAGVALTGKVVKL